VEIINNKDGFSISSGISSDRRIIIIGEAALDLGTKAPAKISIKMPILVGTGIKSFTIKESNKL
jgi:hypothetical protein